MICSAIPATIPSEGHLPVMRVLLLSRYGHKGPSSRLRHYQFLPALARAGISTTVAPLLADSYLESLFSGRPWPLRRVAAAYARRLGWMARARRFDLLWIEKEALPWLPYAAEGSLLRSGPPCVVDFDDAWFHRYDGHRLAPVRRLLGSKLDRVMARAALVTVGNTYLADRAAAAGVESVAILPTVVDLDRYPAPRPDSPPPAPEAEPVVGWIGSPVTARYLDLIADPLRRLSAGARVRLVGAGPHALDDLSPDRHPWREEDEARLIAGFDVGVMPLADTPWERGKCGYKLIQYMACAKPVVASPVGVNREIVEHGVNGFLADTPEEWATALGRLCADPDLRRRMGAAGREKVERSYSLSVAAPRLAALLRAAAGLDGPDAAKRTGTPPLDMPL